MELPQIRYSLESSSETYILPHAPDGWDESLIVWVESKDYFGMFRDFSIPIKFVLDGAWLIRRELYTKYQLASVRLRVELLNRSTWTYSTEYIGELDFSKFQDTKNSFTINVMEA